MFPAERRHAILQLVRANGTVSLRELARAVEFSEVTVRCDLRALEAQGLLDRQRAGATMPGALSHEPTYSPKARTALREKVAIAQLAATLVEPGDAIVLGAGTTTQELARKLMRVAGLTGHHRTPASPVEQAPPLECGNVAADGDLGNVDRLGQVAHGNRTVGAHQLKDEMAAFGAEHGLEPLMRRCDVARRGQEADVTRVTLGAATRGQLRLYVTVGSIGGLA